MVQRIGKPADVQPLGPAEFRPAPPHDAAPPEPAAEDREKDLLKVKEWARQVGGPERLKELCDMLIAAREERAPR